jgi:hypothetical protein
MRMCCIFLQGASSTARISLEALHSQESGIPSRRAGCSSPIPLLPVSFLRYLSLEANPQHRVYLGTSTNKLFRIDNAHQGTPTLTAIPSPLTNNAANVNCIAVDPRNADRIVVVYSNYNIYSLYMSEDGGANWKSGRKPRSRRGRFG